jgi:hypothetical protein
LRPNWTVTEQQTKHRIPTGAHTSKAFQKLGSSIEFFLIWRQRRGLCVPTSFVGARKQVNPGRKAGVTIARQRFLLRSFTRAKHSFMANKPEVIEET